MSRNLWVLLTSISTMTLSFFICPFRVCGWFMPIMVESDILGMFSPSKYDVIFLGFSTYSSSYSSIFDSPFSSTSHVYASFSYIMCGTYVSGPICLYNVYIFLLSFVEIPNLFFHLICVEVCIYNYMSIIFAMFLLEYIFPFLDWKPLNLTYVVIALCLTTSTHWTSCIFNLFWTCGLRPPR